jgi:hypothetical protein
MDDTYFPSKNCFADFEYLRQGIVRYTHKKLVVIESILNEKVDFPSLLLFILMTTWNCLTGKCKLPNNTKNLIMFSLIPDCGT